MPFSMIYDFVLKLMVIKLDIVLRKYDKPKIICEKLYIITLNFRQRP